MIHCLISDLGIEWPSEGLINSSSRSGLLSEDDVFELVRERSYLVEEGGRMNVAVGVAVTA